MGEIQRQGIYNSIIAYVGILLGYINMGILFPFILTPEQVGLFAVVAAIGQVGNTMVSFGIPNIAIRYVPFFRDNPSEKAKFVGFQLFLALVGAFIFVLIYFLLKPHIINWYQHQSPLFVSYSHLVVPFTAFMLLFEFFYGYCRAHFLTIAAGFARDLLFRLAILGLILAFHFQLVSFEQFMWIYAFAYAIPTTYLVVYLVRKHELPVNFRFGSLPNLKEMFVYGGFLSLGSLSAVMINEIDKIMLSGLKDLDAVGVYTVAAFFGSFIIAPARALLMIAAPLIAQFMKEERMDKIASIYSKSAINMLVVGLLLFIGLYVNLHNIFKILPAEYASGYYVIVFIGLSKLFEMATGTNGDIINNSKYYRYDLLFSVILAVLAVGTNMLLIPQYGIVGAAIATAISVFLFNVLKGVFLYWKYKIQPFSIKTFYCLIIGVLALTANYFLPRWDNLFVDLLIRSSIVLAIYVPLLFYFNISPDINDMVVKMLKQARKKGGKG